MAVEGLIYPSFSPPTTIDAIEAMVDRVNTKEVQFIWRKKKPGATWESKIYMKNGVAPSGPSLRQNTSARQPSSPQFFLSWEKIEMDRPCSLIICELLHRCRQVTILRLS